MSGVILFSSLTQFDYTYTSQIYVPQNPEAYQLRIKQLHVHFISIEVLCVTQKVIHVSYCYALSQHF